MGWPPKKRQPKKTCLFRSFYMSTPEDYGHPGRLDVQCASIAVDTNWPCRAFCWLLFSDAWRTTGPSEGVGIHKALYTTQILRYMHTSVHICVHVCTYIPTCLYTCTYTPTILHSYIPTSPHTFVIDIDAYIHGCMQTCIRACIHRYAGTWITKIDIQLGRKKEGKERKGQDRKGKDRKGKGR